MRDFVLMMMECVALRAHYINISCFVSVTAERVIASQPPFLCLSKASIEAFLETLFWWVNFEPRYRPSHPILGESALSAAQSIIFRSYPRTVGGMRIRNEKKTTFFDVTSCCTP